MKPEDMKDDYADAFGDETPPPAAGDEFASDEAAPASAESDTAAAEPGAVPSMTTEAAEPPPAEPAAETPSEAPPEPSPEAPGEASPGEVASPQPEPESAPVAKSDEAAPPPAESPMEEQDEYGKFCAECKEKWGDEFVSDMEKLFSMYMKKNAGPDLGARLDEALDDVRKAFATLHADTISDAHEDFLEVVNSPEFGQWKESLEPDKKAGVESVVDGGSARQVVRMLTEFKNWRDAQKNQDADEMEQFEGVRSASGAPAMRSTAPRSGEYDEAWNQS